MTCPQDAVRAGVSGGQRSGRRAGGAVCLVEETGREIEGPMIRLEELRNVDLVGTPCSRRREPPSWLQELLRPAAGSRPWSLRARRPRLPARAALEEPTAFPRCLFPCGQRVGGMRADSYALVLLAWSRLSPSRTRVQF